VKMAEALRRFAGLAPAAKQSDEAARSDGLAA
jgi:hypothetical protein